MVLLWALQFGLYAEVFNPFWVIFDMVSDTGPISFFSMNLRVFNSYKTQAPLYCLLFSVLIINIEGTLFWHTSDSRKRKEYLKYTQKGHFLWEMHEWDWRAASCRELYLHVQHPPRALWERARSPKFGVFPIPLPCYPTQEIEKQEAPTYCTIFSSGQSIWSSGTLFSYCGEWDNAKENLIVFISSPSVPWPRYIQKQSVLFFFPFSSWPLCLKEPKHLPSKHQFFTSSSY